MNRCHKTGARLASALMMCAALAGASLSIAPAPAFAQMIRSVPADVKLAKMVITQPPVITLNGQVDRLSPGSRIRDLNNMVVLSGSITNLELPVVYKRDAAGLVHEVWLLTPAEYTKLGGVNTGDPEGVVRFAALLAAIFGARP
ncbi:hypothetical protein GHT07_13485 [Caenimonas koreensis DSM 17982]|uniref:Uncharacterized protein n=1 Tax=Caenimonas koreensis DSM 17982 TaxID=1121255 RepID=A0A844B9Z2_9BURK|nr:hypothetical protein [Caenimonas koreensis]MRD48297.1 hypothetical protein [Caenimonas koreensis DSM 17982]